MLQNQRQTKNLYRIDSNQNLYRIILEVFTKRKIQHMFTWYFLMWGYWFCSTYEFALSDFFFVEGSWLCRNQHPSLESRGWFSNDFFCTWPRGPLLDQGVQPPPPNCKGGLYIYILYIYMCVCVFLLSISWRFNVLSLAYNQTIPDTLMKASLMFYSIALPVSWVAFPLHFEHGNDMYVHIITYIYI